MEIFVELLILLVATRACGEVAIRIGQPVAVGELMAGIGLAMIIAKFGAQVPFLEDLAESPVLEFVADFGIFFLVLLAGIEMRPKEMSEASKASLFVAVGGVVVPLTTGFGLFLPATDMKLAQALLVGVAVFFAITISLGVHVYPRVSRRIKEMRMAALEFSALVGVGMAYGLLAEVLGMHWVIGAFMAGLYFESHRVGDLAYADLKLAVGAITNGFLGPLFFATIGLRVDLGAVTAVPLFLALLLVVAFAGKFIGCGGPALLAGLKPREATAVGVGMSARGAVELVVLNIAYGAGLFAVVSNGDPLVDNLYSALVLMAVITTLGAPIILRTIITRNVRCPGGDHGDKPQMD